MYIKRDDLISQRIIEDDREFRYPVLTMNVSFFFCNPILEGTAITPLQRNILIPFSAKTRKV